MALGQDPPDDVPVDLYGLCLRRDGGKIVLSALVDPTYQGRPEWRRVAELPFETLGGATFYLDAIDNAQADPAPGEIERLLAGDHDETPARALKARRLTKGPTYEHERTPGDSDRLRPRDRAIAAALERPGRHP